MNSDLTIISVNKNNYSGLINTLHSVSELPFFDSYNHLIVDGNSSDMQESFHHLQSCFKFSFVSEDDSGIFNAMNKGVRMALGNRLLFLNSGDTIKNVLNFNRFIYQCPDKDIVYSNLCKVYIDNDLYVESKFPKILSLDYMICFGLPHQATIINKDLFDRVGFYDERYSIISDWVFFMESIFFYNATYEYVDVTAINFDASGISNQNKYLQTIISEQLDYISKKFPSKIDLYKTNSPYVKKYFRSMPRWKKIFFKFIFMNFNILNFK